MSEYDVFAPLPWFGWFLVTAMTAGYVFIEAHDLPMAAKLSWVIFWPVLGPAVGLLGIVEMWQIRSVKNRARLEAEYRRAVKELEVER